MVKFLGVHFTPTLSWNYHIEYLNTKARKSLNLLKVISKQVWAHDVAVLKHLALSLVRSRLIYGQEAFFSAPKSLLQKMTRLDCKAFRIALGVPFHASSMGTYNEIGILPLDNYRQLAVAKYLLRCSKQETNVDTEISVRSDVNFPKRAQ